MQWVIEIALFLLLSELLLELISDTKYVQYARWVSGVILLLLFVRPFVGETSVSERMEHLIRTFYFRIGTERVPEELYLTEQTMENKVIKQYKQSMEEQITRLLDKSSLRLCETQIQLEEDGEPAFLFVRACYMDGTSNGAEIAVPTIAPVEVGGRTEKNTISPMELYVRELLAEFYQMDVNKIEVVIEKAG